MVIKVLKVSGSMVDITDGNNVKTVTKEQLDRAISEGKVEIDNLKVECVYRHRDKKRRIVAYDIVHIETGAKKTVEVEVLKRLILNYQIEVKNLKLTSDGKLLSTDLIGIKEGILEGFEVVKANLFKSVTNEAPSNQYNISST